MTNSLSINSEWPHDYVIKEFQTVDSTNRVASNVYKNEHLQAPTWIFSREQTAGIARRSRQWVSLSNNLNATLIFPTQSSKDSLPPLSFIASLAVYDVAEHILTPCSAVVRLNVKWPNDVLVNNRKVSGILLEAINHKTDISAVLVGIGVNLNNSPLLGQVSSPSSVPIDLSSIINEPVDPCAAMIKLAYYFSNWVQAWQFHGTAYIMDAWRMRAVGLGANGIVRLENSTVEGYLHDVDDRGVLLIDTKEGRKEIYAADIFVF